MIELQDLVVACEKKQVVGKEAYNCIYFSFGPKDPTEGVNATKYGAVVGTKIVPKERFGWGKSVHDSDELFAAAVEKLQKLFPKEDPLRIMLTLTETALNYSIRSPINLRLNPPAATVDVEKEIVKHAGKLFTERAKMGRMLTMEECVKRVRANWE